MTFAGAKEIISFAILFFASKLFEIKNYLNILRDISNIQNKTYSVKGNFSNFLTTLHFLEFESKKIQINDERMITVRATNLPVRNLVQPDTELRLAPHAESKNSVENTTVIWKSHLINLLTK